MDHSSCGLFFPFSVFNMCIGPNDSQSLFLQFMNSHRRMFLYRGFSVSLVETQDNKMNDLNEWTKTCESLLSCQGDEEMRACGSGQL